jgi:probable addiction module antidote protein/putative addiction module killer protein
MRAVETQIYRDWINALKDHAGRARIQVRVDRLVHGNPGQHRDLTDGISELKIDFGPGYRVLHATRKQLPSVARWRRQVDTAKRHHTGDPSRQEFSGVAIMLKPAARKPAKTKTVLYDVAEQLRTTDEMAAYLDAWLEEAPEDAAGIARALGDIARAKGMTQVAKDAGLSRESLYRALSADGNPSFATVLKVARALGVRLHVEAA